MGTRTSHRAFHGAAKCHLVRTPPRDRKLLGPRGLGMVGPGRYALLVARDLYIVVGMPGTGVRRGLSAFVDHARHRGTTVSVVSVDAHLEELARPHVARLFGIPSRGMVGPLLLPQEYLRRLWLEAFGRARAEVRSLRERGARVLLTLHLAYFHHLTREYLTVVDYDALRSAAREDGAEAVVTLIDDIYDCHARLAQVGGRFEAPADLDSAIIQLLDVLNWRSTELLLASSLSSGCGVKHFVFAVKHPQQTLYDLLFTDKRRAYLSHPISEPRRLHREGRTDDARRFVGQMGELVARLQAQYVVFEPTAIDELRLARIGTEPAGHLDMRWPFGRDERPSLFVPCPAASATCFPVEWTADARGELAVTQLTRELAAAIEQQIGARDHALVEQSDLVVCFRPLYQGNASRGVREEIFHFNRLVELGLRERRPHVIAFNPPEDRVSYRQRQFVDFITVTQQARSIAGDAGGFDAWRERIRTNDAAVGELAERVRAGDAVALLTLCRQFGLRVEPDQTGLLPTGAMGTTPEARRDLAAGQLAQSVRTGAVDYLQNPAVAPLVTECSTEAEFQTALGL